MTAASPRYMMVNILEDALKDAAGNTGLQNYG